MNNSKEKLSQQAAKNYDINHRKKIRHNFQWLKNI